MKTVLVDAMILAYKSYATLGWMATKGGEPTGLRFGFLRSLLSYQKKLNAEQIYVVWDAAGPIGKADKTPEYKANRVPTEAAKTMFGQLSELRHLIHHTKFTQVWKEGYEADDLIGALAQVDDLKPMVIVSTDADLHQHAAKGVHIWTGDSKNHTVGPFDIESKWGVKATQIPLLRSALGDVSDNLAPLLESKESKTYFKTFLGLHNDITTTDELANWPDMDKTGIPGIGIPEAAWFDVMRERERVMRPNIPPANDWMVLKGTSDKPWLEDHFQKMESKTFQRELFQLL